MNSRVSKPLLALLAFGATACFHHRAAPVVSNTPLMATPQMVDSLWNTAMDLYQRHKWDKAAAAFDRVELELPPGDHRVLTGRLYLAQLYVREGSYLQGVREYQRLVEEFPTDSVAPEALLAAGDAYAKLWRAPDLDDTYGKTAQGVYTDVTTRFPNSPAAAKARQRLQKLDNWFAIKEYKGAVYYLKMKAYESAILYLKDLVATYPNAAIVPDALKQLIATYRKLGYTTDITEKCAYMRRDWSQTPQYRSACGASTPAGAENAPR
ncbi:MAG: outer membrane protein assembly factor BamD [Gemmatimonadales bacterium]